MVINLRYKVQKYFKKKYTSFKIALIDEFKIPILGVKVWFEQLFNCEALQLQPTHVQKLKGLVIGKFYGLDILITAFYITTFLS